MLNHHPGRIVLAILAMLAMCACGGNKLKANMTTEERLAYAEKLFADGDYLDAQTQLRIIILNAPGSAVVDRAQFLLGESHFKMKEYVLAAAEYEKLVRLYTRSEFVDDAQYKVGLCYYELSPRSDLDQKYSLLAISEFQKFAEDFPDSPMIADVAEKLTALREKLAKKEYGTATLYRRMAFYDAALISYEDVLNTFYDTRFAEPALYYKAECLLKLGRSNEAVTSLQFFLGKYLQSDLRERARELLQSIEAKPAANGETKP